jgi:hypothetical protein
LNTALRRVYDNPASGGHTRHRAEGCVLFLEHHAAVHVQRGTNASGKIEVTGRWSGGRVGVFTEDKDFHGKASGDKGELPVGKWDGYVPLVEAISKCFQTGIAPVKPEETLEIYAFMDAVEESRRKGGATVPVQLPAGSAGR